MLGGDVFEDERPVVVHLRAPGLEKEDFPLEVRGDTLWLRGTPFQRASGAARVRVVQCACGALPRAAALAAAVQPGRASARCRNSVLRVELPRLAPGHPAARTIPVH